MGSYKAEFLWNDNPDSIEALGYEFANAKSEEYREKIWHELINRIRSEGKETSDEPGNCNKPHVSVSLPEIDIDKAEALAISTDYYTFAVGEDVNTADAGAFFLEGYMYAKRLIEGNER